MRRGNGRCAKVNGVPWQGAYTCNNRWEAGTPTITGDGRMPRPRTTTASLTCADYAHVARARNTASKPMRWGHPRHACGADGVHVALRPFNDRNRLRHWIALWLDEHAPHEVSSQDIVHEQRQGDGESVPYPLPRASASPKKMPKSARPSRW